jgi:hypothetical protein
MTISLARLHHSDHDVALEVGSAACRLPLRCGTVINPTPSAIVDRL